MVSDSVVIWTTEGVSILTTSTAVRGGGTVGAGVAVGVAVGVGSGVFVGGVMVGVGNCVGGAAVKAGETDGAVAEGSGVLVPLEQAAKNSMAARASGAIFRIRFGIGFLSPVEDALDGIAH